jgi:hypothetical protein
MSTIFKTWQKATYLEGFFRLRDNTQRWAHPIEFPTVFTANGRAIKSGNWKSYTSINTPNYVIEHYFDTIGHGENDTMNEMWGYCKKLENINWDDVKKDENSVLSLINLANNELLKLRIL